MKKISNIFGRDTLFFIILCILFQFYQEKKTIQTHFPIKKSREFKEKIYLKGEEILSNEIGAVAIHVVDDFILLYQKEQKYAYSVYDSKLNQLGKLGRIGEGPNEWIFPFYASQFDKKNATISIWLNDRIKHKFHQINLTESIKRNETVIDKTVSTKPEWGFTQNLLLLDNNKLIGNVGFVPKEEKGRLRVYDMANNKIHNTILFPKLENSHKLNIDHLYHTYFDVICVKPDRSKIVSAMRSFDRIDIFNSDAELTLSIEGNGKSPDLSAYKPDTFKSLLMSYYVSVDVSDKYIYASYYNQPKIDFGRKNVPTQVHIFDWEGNPKVQIQVDDYLMNIAVDEKNGFLYGVDFYNEKIMRYNIRRILE